MTLIGRKLANSLIKEGVITKNSSKHKAILEMEEIGEVILSALPESILYIDADYLIDLKDYIVLFHRFMSLTNTKYDVELDTKQTKDKENKITITYHINSKKHSFNFTQSDLIVSYKFLESMEKLSKKHLDGVFVTYYGGSSFVEYAYVPRKVAAAINSVNFSPESLVEIIENNNLDAYYNTLDSIGQNKLYEIIKILNKDDELYVPKLLMKLDNFHIATEMADRFFNERQKAACLPACKECGEPAIAYPEKPLCGRCSFRNSLK